MYVPDNQLTDAYIQTLIARNNFVDVTAQNPDAGCTYAIRDLEGTVTFYFDMPSTRDDMIRKYLIIQNG